jgi:hypothetical protein
MKEKRIETKRKKGGQTTRTPVEQLPATLRPLY